MELEETQDPLQKHEKQEMEKEIKLGSVIEFKNLLHVLFKYNKKDLALSMIHKCPEEIQLRSDIFELCLEYDEDIAM